MQPMLHPAPTDGDPEQQRIRSTIVRLTAIVESSPDAIIGITLDGEITSWNSAAAKIYGYAAEEVLGRSLTMLAPPDRIDELLGILGRLKRGKRIEGLETVRRRKDGKSIWVALSAAPVVDVAHGLEKAGASVIDRDISDRKQLEEQFLQSQKMEAVGQLAAGVAHDFNNLLTIILGYSELLLCKLPPTDPNRQPMGQIRRAAERASDLTRQLLAFGRKQILAPVVLDVNSLMTETEKMLRRLIGEDIELTTLLQSGLGRVKADPGQVEQCIMNLVVNARDAMPRGGRLTIRTSNTVISESQIRQHPDVLPGPYTVLAVSDTGSGMDETTKARIFEPFFTTKEVGKGTGLGLATVFGIAKQSGGFIEVESALGSGSTFRICLPQIPEETCLKDSEQGLVKISKGMETILLVEDEDGLRELAQLILEASDYKVLSTRDGAEALGVSQKYAGAIDMLFTDVVMPNMSGRQLAELLIPLRPKMKVLYMSGYTDDTMVRHGIQNSATNFLPKPFTPIALAQKVREVLDRTDKDEDTVSADLCPPAAGPVCAT